MRSRLVAVGLGAVLVGLFAFAGTAAAVPVTGSVSDEQDATQELLATGRVRDNPDLRRLTVSYDAPSGIIEVTVELWRALAYDGTYQYGGLSFDMGSRYDAAGECVADTTGDPTVYINIFRNDSRPQDSYVTINSVVIGGVAVQRVSPTREEGGVAFDLDQVEVASGIDHLLEKPRGVDLHVREAHPMRAHVLRVAADVGDHEERASGLHLAIL